MSKYKITLTPLDWFFFGGEQTFDNGERQSFIARSNRMPQQTTLLGMVRYQLLKWNNLLLCGDKEKDESKLDQTKVWVGENSFNIESTEPQSFGKIKKISPVFIQKGNHKLMPMPLTNGINVRFVKGDVWMNGVKRDKTIDAVFDEKNYSNYVKFIDDEQKPWDYIGDHGIFSSTMQIGITKADSGDENEKGFFKQETLRFKDVDTSYAFFLELEDGTEFKDDIVFIGAQQSCFKMEVKPYEEGLFIPDHPEGSILLLSPTYISNRETLDDNCLQCWSGTITFRNLQQRSNGKLQSGVISYHRQSSMNSFLTAGSIIFYENETQLNNLKGILDNLNLKNIGYNIYDVK